MVTYGASDLNLDLGAAGVTVERMAPAEWPPLVGDLWRDSQDDLWFAFSNWTGGSGYRLAMMPQNPTSTFMPVLPERFLMEMGPAVLVHREPQPVDTEGGAS
jgi:hypothetical protein